MRTALMLRIAFLWEVLSMPYVHEKGMKRDQYYSYPEPTLVPLGEKPKVCRCNPIKGTRQIGPVPSV